MKTSSSCPVLATLLYNNHKKYTLTKLRTVIGSGTSVDIRVNDALVAKTQAEIQFIPQKRTMFSGKQQIGELGKGRYTIILKAFTAKSTLDVYVNQLKVPNSTVLKDKDIISFGNKRHNFVFSLLVDGQQTDVNSLTTPSKTSKACNTLQQRNLIGDFDVPKSEASNCSQAQVVPQPQPTTTEVSPIQQRGKLPQTPYSSARIARRLKDDANVKKAYSPSICRYFRQINAKSSHILSCIEELLPSSEPKVTETEDTQFSAEKSTGNLDDGNISEHTTNPMAQVPSSNVKQKQRSFSLSLSPTHLLVNVSESEKTPSKSKIKCASPSSAKMVDISSALNTALRLSGKWSSPMHFTKAIRTAARELSTQKPSGQPADYDTPALQSIRKLFQRNSPYFQTVHLPRLRQLFQPRTPPANYNPPHLAQIRALYQAHSPLCQYEPEYMPAIRKIYQNETPPAQYDGGHLASIRGLYRVSPSADYTQAQVASVRKLFQANTPKRSEDSGLLSQIRYLNQISPHCNYNHESVQLIPELFNWANTSEATDPQMNGIRRVKNHFNSEPNANYTENVQYLRYLFRQVASPASPRVNIRRLFSAGTPPANYEEHVDESDILYREEDIEESASIDSTQLHSLSPHYGSLSSRHSYSHDSDIFWQVNASTSSSPSKHSDEAFSSSFTTAFKSPSIWSLNSSFTPEEGPLFRSKSPAVNFTLPKNSPSTKEPTPSASLTLAFPSPSMSPVTSLPPPPPVPVSRRAGLRKTKPIKRYEDELAEANAKMMLKKLAAKKRQPKKIKVTMEKVDEKVLQPVKRTKAKRATKKTKTAKEQKTTTKAKAGRARMVKFLSPCHSSASSITTMLDQLDVLSDRFDKSNTGQVSALFPMKARGTRKTTDFTSKQLETLRMVLSDSFDAELHQ